MSAVVDTVGGLVGGLLGVKKPEAPAAPAPAPQASDAEIQQRAEDQRRLMASANGRASTILTDLQTASMQDQTSAAKTLFGS